MVEKEANKIPDASQTGQSFWRKYKLQIITFFLILAVGGFGFWWANWEDWVYAVRSEATPAVWESETANRVQMFKEQYGIDLTNSQNSKMLTTVRQDMLKSLIDTALMHRAAVREGVVVPEAEVNNMVAQAVVQYNGYSQFLQILQDNKMTIDDYRRQVKEAMLINSLEASLGQGSKISEQEMINTYQSSKSSYIKPESVKVGHVLLKTDAQARSIINLLKGGADFQATADKYSIDPGIKQTHGLLGYITKNDTQIPDAFKQAAFATPVGHFTLEPVQTDYGYHVIFVFDKRAAAQATYSEARSQIYDQLLTQKTKVLAQAYLTKLQKKVAFMYKLKKL